MCLPGAVVAYWFLTQEVAGSNPFTDKYFKLLNLLNSRKPFRENSNKMRHFVKSLVLIMESIDWVDLDIDWDELAWFLTGLLALVSFI